MAKEINGYFLEDVYDKKADAAEAHRQERATWSPASPHLQADGTTSCGNWIYCGVYTQKDGKAVNMMARRGKKDPTGLGLYPEWAWAGR